MQIDDSELQAFAEELGQAPDRLEPEVSRIVERGGLNIKNTARDLIRAQIRGKYLPHYPNSIDYDMISPLEVEVGPNASKSQGSMGRGVEFGSVNKGPLPHMFPAFEQEEPRFVDQVADAVVRTL